jgi:hypothetical protein
MYMSKLKIFCGGEENRIYIYINKTLCTCRNSRSSVAERSTGFVTERRISERRVIQDRMEERRMNRHRMTDHRMMNVERDPMPERRIREYG